MHFQIHLHHPLPAYPAEIFPQHLHNVDWMSCRVVEDVHRLLENLDPRSLDVTVALELLSIDFADVLVRRLAVKKLKSLSNEDVLKYLLQLVQVCMCIGGWGQKCYLSNFYKVFYRNSLLAQLLRNVLNKCGNQNMGLQI